MSRKLGIVALVVMLLVAVAAGPADAHYTIVSGKLVYHSVECQSAIKQVQNLEKNPALANCTLVGTVVEVECSNPQGKIVRGTASHPIPFEAVSTSLDQTPLEKKQGRAHVIAEVIEDSITLGLTSEDGVCNNNWVVTRALLRNSSLTIDVYPCGSVCSPAEDITPTNRAATATFSCVTPADLTLDDVPFPDNTTINCNLESFTHIQ